MKNRHKNKKSIQGLGLSSSIPIPPLSRSSNPSTIPSTLFSTLMKRLGLSSNAHLKHSRNSQYSISTTSSSSSSSSSQTARLSSSDDAKQAGRSVSMSSSHSSSSVAINIASSSSVQDSMTSSSSQVSQKAMISDDLNLTDEECLIMLKELEGSKTFETGEKLISQDLQDAEDNMISWLSLLPMIKDEEDHVKANLKAYLNRLLSNIKTIQRYLLLPLDEITADQAKRIIINWKSANRRDMKDYFKKKMDKQPVSIQPPLSLEQAVCIPLTLPSALKGKLSELEFNYMTYEWLLEDGTLVPYLPHHQMQIQAGMEKMYRQIKENKETIEDEIFLRIESKDKEKIESKDKKTVENDPLFATENKNEISSPLKGYTLKLGSMAQYSLKSKTERPFFEMDGGSQYGPAIWGAIPSLEGVCALIPVNPASPAFPIQSVVRSFRQACPEYSVLKVEVNYNPEKWLLFNTLRNDYKKRMPSLECRYLWHGTNATNVSLICAQGFLRDYGKQHTYGEGCYFARSPQYAIQIQYAVPYEDNKQTIILSYVLVGDVLKGYSTYKIAHSHDPEYDPKVIKNEDLLPFENTVDRCDNPTIYTTRDDHQAFPAVVLTVRKEPWSPYVKNDPSLLTVRSQSIFSSKAFNEDKNQKEVEFIGNSP